jgi:hypothetical protein
MLAPELHLLDLHTLSSPSDSGGEEKGRCVYVLRAQAFTATGSCHCDIEMLPEGPL